MQVTLPISKLSIDITQARANTIQSTIDGLARNANTNNPFIYRAAKIFIDDLKISHLTIKDVEYAILIRMALTNIDTVLKTSSKCPNCNHIGHINQIDVQDLPISENIHTTYTINMLNINELKSKYPKIKIETNEDYEKRINGLYEEGIITIKNNLEKLIVKSMTFHLPTLDELVKSEEEKPTKFTENVLLHSIDYIEYIYDGHASVYDWKDVKNRFNYDLLKFSNNVYKDIIVKMWNDVGIIPYIDYRCSSCGYDAKTSFDFINFFVFGILPKDMIR